MPSFSGSGVGAKQAWTKRRAPTIPAFVYTAQAGPSTAIDGGCCPREQIGLENTGFHSPGKDLEAHGVDSRQLSQTDNLGSRQSIPQHPIDGILAFPRSFPKRFSAPRWGH